MASKRKRIVNEKAKAKRARSWAKNQEAKRQRIAEQEARHAHNLKVGSTGKQRANQAAKERKAPVEQEDLLET